MTGWLDGRRALVVGAGSGIGRAVVDAFLSEGARVAVLERDEAKCAKLSAAIPGLPVVAGDATTRGANEAAVDATVAAYGGLDVLVSCVGIFDFYQGIAELPVERIDEAFDEMFRVNVKSHLHSVKAALPQLRRHGGSVILTESTSAYYPGRGGVLYVGSKFAVRGLVTAMAHELAPDVRVNGVAPGGTLNTDLRGLDSLGLREKRLDDTPGREAELAGRVPLRVALSGADHAWSYVFLASNRARGITGDVVHPDGGIGVKA
ncbi:3-(cis-5,6-dihydroxycyclohexa-1,3-dien-1-yl)propanoate dehydrogenase [Amycolatopsis acidiphila]|uniref:3-(Cis-5,6-dihydroxycyclohexa-1, 3-dien-1-yl)propanoate dehydrogenase n=1 Tax=Amycolatopsis acidiphila TaxID=715473 RepID=A0A557ZZT4_9PSEU|nr:3-(cis-5,6-dihydroxycyclohexa-1,3-dien-1-yl)propanoate dehydrogenase [Amycolatopsis acidiphila]TVT17528.1 3-(cis-5,6-dihydroxycyclohexa-1,3-dien-1-yl)propanoate dehydrogenase [Amycolatopsis acidiphila]UIJ57662.1 3-(cis-5,6-dihydroxycyclohexa-1,3-dien-1-yl)propanoate dehydrogenase [Amycolatopsis acidiphila]GHG95497.1 3-(cis-5,6-dihydroxycyclohexa-1, 3-dien-1-yl)propanoate dehydrogenase [Amycolatopsis acidiphila]